MATIEMRRVVMPDGEVLWWLTVRCEVQTSSGADLRVKMRVRD